MTSILAFSVFGVDWQLLKPFIVIGLAFGGVYALSGVGLVVLYRATGRLNVAFGAIGATGALIAYYRHSTRAGRTGWPSRSACHRRGHQPLLRDGVGPPRTPRSARQDDGNARFGAHPARDHGLACADRRCVCAAFFRSRARSTITRSGEPRSASLRSSRSDSRSRSPSG